MTNHWIKEGVIYGLAGVLSKFTGFFLVPIYTHFLTPKTYGVLDLCTVVSAILLIASETQMASGVMRSYYEVKEKSKRPSLVGTAVCYYLMTNTVLWIIAWSLQGSLAHFFPELQFNLLLPILVGILPTQLVQLTLILLRLEHRPSTYLFLSVGQVILASALGILMVVLFKADVVGILWGFSLSQLIFAIPAILLCHRLVGIRISLFYFGEIFTYGAPIVPAVLGNWLQSYAARFFILSALSLSVLGLYSVAIKAASVILLLIQAFRRTWDPYAIKQFTLPETEIQFAKALNLYLFSAFLGVFLFSAGSPILLRILAPEPYWSMLSYVPILIVAHLWHGSTIILAAGNSWERKTYYNTVGSLSGGFVIVMLLWWGIDRFGLPMVALSSWVGAVVKALLTLWTAQYNHYIPYSQRTIWGTLLIGFLYPIACYILLECIALDLFSTIAVLLAMGSMFQLVIWFTLLQSEERTLMKSVVAGQFRSFMKT